MSKIYIISKRSDLFLIRSILKDQNWMPRQYSMGEVGVLVKSGNHQFENLDLKDRLKNGDIKNLDDLTVMAETGKIAIMLHDQAKDEILQYQEKRSLPKCVHSDDFTSVLWCGELYTFSKGNQASAVKLLWQCWENGTPGITQETIGRKIDSSSEKFRIANTFRGHAALGRMIVKAGKGCFQLKKPEK